MAYILGKHNRIRSAANVVLANNNFFSCVFTRQFVMVYLGSNSKRRSSQDGFYKNPKR